MSAASGSELMVCDLWSASYSVRDSRQFENFPAAFGFGIPSARRLNLALSLMAVDLPEWEALELLLPSIRKRANGLYITLANVQVTAWRFFMLCLKR